MKILTTLFGFCAGVINTIMALLAVFGAYLFACVIGLDMSTRNEVMHDLDMGFDKLLKKKL